PYSNVMDLGDDDEDHEIPPSTNT
ncbi:unnamed protein product, partial [Rotaria sordida]